MYASHKTHVFVQYNNHECDILNDAVILIINLNIHIAFIESLNHKDVEINWSENLF